jgi:hypothetical protein
VSSPCRVGKGALAPCPPSSVVRGKVGTLALCPPYGSCAAPSPSLRGAIATKQSIAPHVWRDGLLRFARNDVSHTSAFSRHDLSELCSSFRPLIEQRVQGMPGARCTRGLVCKGGKRSAHEHTGSAEALRHSLRDGFTAYTCSPRRDRALLSPPPQRRFRALRERTPTTGASGPHDFTVRPGTFVSCATAATASHRNVRDDRERPSIG